MKFFTNKKVIQKIIIALVLVISCNFIVPTYIVQANVLGDVASGIGGFVTDAFVGLIVSIVDAAFNGVQNFMIGGDYHLSFMKDRDDVDEYYRSTRTE